jgi:hypothetical protein
MNNTTNLTAIVAVFMAAILVVGTFATTPAAFAAKNNNNNSGNTVTIQKCKQAATESGFDNTEEQECQNLICTHPGENATCTQEGVTTSSTPLPPTTGTLLVTKVVVCVRAPCPEASTFPITVTGNNPQPSTFPGSETGTLVTLGPGTYTVNEATFPGSFVAFNGDCTQTALNSGKATGTISAGEHQICTITNSLF